MTKDIKSSVDYNKRKYIECTLQGQELWRWPAADKTQNLCCRGTYIPVNGGRQIF